jgi:hypothetical protein
MARLTAPDSLPDVRIRESARGALDTARSSVDQARDAIDTARDAIDGGPRVPTPDVDLAKVGETIRRTVGEVVNRAADALPDRAPDPAVVVDKLPKRADVLAAVPGALEIARRMPSMREVKDAAGDVGSSAREVALETARKTPLRDHPAIRRGPGPVGIALRLGVAWLVAAGAALLIVNRERVRTFLVEARTRAARMAASRGAGGVADTGTWSSSDLGGGTAVDEVLLIETVDTSSAGLGSTGSDLGTTGTLGGVTDPLASDQPAGDLDAAGWGTEGRPTSPRKLSSDVASMTEPTPAPSMSDELGE